MLKFKIFCACPIFVWVLISALTPVEKHAKLPKNVKYKLSEYGFFQGDLSAQNPAEGVLPYDINTPLFSDYASKLRFVKLPQGKSAQYNAQDVMDFPVGSVLIKTFYYPDDMRKPDKGRRLLETRLLMHEEDGWYALPYIWNEAQTEAQLEVIGGTLDINWKHTDGKKRQLQYSVPNINQCKGCHIKEQQIKPIGPSARQLNRSFAYQEGEENQIKKWQAEGILTDAPSLEDIPRLAVWDDPSTGTLNARARAYLDINCAHCHGPEAPANTSGLLLNHYQTDTTALGIRKTPVAAGRGSGGLQYDILPGQPKASILWYRMSSEDPGIMMPELGRKLIHEEGLQLIETWISTLPE